MFAGTRRHPCATVNPHPGRGLLCRRHEPPRRRPPPDPGQGLSFNNLNDTDAAFELAAEFKGPAVAIIKHANPCGVALGGSPSPSTSPKALAADPVSAFGGIIAVNRRLDGATAAEIAKLFVEVVILHESTTRRIRRCRRSATPGC